MARKILNVTISDEGRDKDKVFVLTEMPASQAERWAARALFALMNSGVTIPDNIASTGLAGIAALGIKALGRLPFELAEPLLDEMFECVKIMPNPEVTRALIEDDIEEMKTRIQLRKEIFNLHTSFFITAAPLTQVSAAPDQVTA